jgi:hypothetical protein
VVVLVIDQDGVFSLEAKGETPVSAYRDRPVALEVAVQGVKPPSGRIQILGRAGIVKHCQLETQTHGVLSLNPHL